VAIIMVGIAFGIAPERQRIGEILVSKQLLAYELQRVGTSVSSEAVVRSRGDRPSASPRLLDRFRNGEMDWTGAQVRFGLVLSGDKLVDNQDFRDKLLAMEPEAIGGEMEGAGLYAAAQRQKVDWLLVKGICDYADGNKHQDKDKRQQTAARNAARFVLHVLRQGGFGNTANAELQQSQAHHTSATSTYTPVGDDSSAGARATPTTDADTQNHTSRVLRQLLDAALSDQEISTVAFDYFQEIYNQFSAGMSKGQKTEMLVAYCVRQGKTDTLIEVVKQLNPNQCQRFRLHLDAL